MGEEQKSTTGGESIDPKLAALLSYITIVGIVFLIISKDKFVRFHALQSIFLAVVFVALAIILSLIPFAWFFGWLVWPLYLILVIVSMIKAYQGEKYKIPFIGDFAEKNS